MRVKIIEIIKIKEKLGKYSRITHHALILNMNGKSFRRKKRDVSFILDEIG